MEFYWKEMGSGAVTLWAKRNRGMQDCLSMQAQWRTDMSNLLQIYRYVQNHLPARACPLPYLEELYEGKELQNVRSSFGWLVVQEVGMRTATKDVRVELTEAWDSLLADWPEQRGLVHKTMMEQLERKLLHAAGHVEPGKGGLE